MHGERPPAKYEHWDFKLGRDFEEDILLGLGSSVLHPSSPPSGSPVFYRSSFCLMEESVGMALHSIIGGFPGGFHIACIKPCHFRFVVAYKAVGFLVRALKRITMKNFDVYFHLWRDGGANWQHELRDWEDEEEGQWTLVTKKKIPKVKHVNFSSPPMKKTPSPGVQAIKFGSSCLLQDPPTLDADQTASSSSPILVSRVFGNLRQQLNSNSISNLNSQAFRTSSRPLPSTAPPNLQWPSHLPNCYTGANKQLPGNSVQGSPVAMAVICHRYGPNGSQSMQGCFRCLALDH
jgi:hypothetical protein